MSGRLNHIRSCFSNDKRTNCVRVAHHMKLDHPHIPVVEATREQDTISVWRMPTNLSQSRLGGRSAPSNACTVIAVRMAEVIHRTDTKMPAAVFQSKAQCKEHNVQNKVKRAAAGHEEVLQNKPSSVDNSEAVCPSRVVSCLTNAIVDGNSIHEEAVKCRGNGEQNFTIPDAIRACKNAVKEIDFCSVPGPLSTELPFYVRAVTKSPALFRDPRLFLLLIAFERTVLIVFERAASSLTLFDSHMHGQSEAYTSGAVIATGHLDNVEDLSNWLSFNIFHESQTQRDRNRDFEISLIRFCGKALKSDCCSPTVSVPSEFPVFAAARRRRKRRQDMKSNSRLAKLSKTDPTTDRVENQRSSNSSRTPTIPLSSLENLRSRN